MRVFVRFDERPPVLELCPRCHDWANPGHMAEPHLWCPAYGAHTSTERREPVLWELACTVVRERQERSQEVPRWS